MNKNYKVDDFTLDAYKLEVLYYLPEWEESKTADFDAVDFMDWCQSEYGTENGYFQLSGGSPNDATIDVDFDEWWDASDSKQKTETLERYVNYQFAGGGLSLQSNTILKYTIERAFYQDNANRFDQIQLIQLANELNLVELAAQMQDDLDN